MKRILKMRNLLLAAVAVLCVGASTAGTADACDRKAQYRRTKCVEKVRYVKVVTYRYEKKPETHWVTITDSYGCRHRYKVTLYRIVKVAVTRWIKVYG